MQQSRKRLRCAVAVALVASSDLCCSAFLTGPSQSVPTVFLFGRRDHHDSTQTASSRMPTTTASLAAAAAAAATTKKPYATADFRPRQALLTSKEQQELLGDAVEMRRIKTIEKELGMKEASLKPSNLSVCRAAGYGDDLDALTMAIDKGLSARETMVTRNMGLVHFCVNGIIGKQKQQLRSLSRDDLVQEGAIGLARAVDRWNPEIGGRFSTYAVYWIRAAILRCIAERDELVRVPEHVSAAVRKMTTAAHTMGLEFDGQDILASVYYGSSGRRWKEAEVAKALAEKAGLTDKQLHEAMKVRQRRSDGVLSFESWMQQGRNFEADLAPVVADNESLTSLEKEGVKQTLARFLRPREVEALCWRYGLTTESSATSSKRDYLAKAEERVFGKTAMPVRGKWGEAMSFDEVGKRMEVSAEYGRRLCHAALEKLKQAAKEGALEPALLF